MAENKTQKTKVKFKDFLATVDASKKKDCEAIALLMEKVTGTKPIMWGPAIVGFGDHHYVYESGREGDWFLLGFSPRKANFAMYLVGGLDEVLLAKLGKHKTGKSCLYINCIEDVDIKVLEMLMRQSIKRISV